VLAPRFADVEQLLVTRLIAVTGRRVVTDLPAEITQPLLHVRAFGGTGLDATRETVSVDVDAYVPPGTHGHPDRGAAHDLAQEARAAFGALPGYTAATAGDVTATVLRVATISRPVIRTYDESAVRRCHAAYRLTVASRG